MTVAPETRTRTRPSTPHYRLTFGHLVRSEFLKLLSLRSTWWTLGISLGLWLVVALLTGWVASAAPAQVASSITPVTAATGPITIVMLVAGILGAIAITGEYSTGMIRSTLTAAPRRGEVLLAKATVIAGLMIALSVVAMALSALISTPMMSAGIDWSQPAESIRPLALGVVATVVFALMGLGFGFIIRNGAGAIAVTVGILFVVPILLGILTGFGGEQLRWLLNVADYLPMAASSAAMSSDPSANLFGPIVALIAWAVVPLILGWVVLRTRDA